MKRELRRLERRWLSSKLEIDRQRFKDFSYQYNEEIKQAKLEYHKMQFENCNSKQLFQKVEKLSKPKSSKSPTPRKYMKHHLLTASPSSLPTK